MNSFFCVTSDVPNGQLKFNVLERNAIAPKSHDANAHLNLSELC